MGVFVPEDIRLRNFIKYNNGKFLPAEENQHVPQEGTLGSNFTTTSHVCYIVEVDKPDGALANERIEIQFVPNSIDLTRDANFTEIMVVARNNPKYHYVNGKDSMRFTVEFYSDEKSRTDVIRKVRWLKSLTMNDGYNKGLKRVLVKFGDIFKDNETWLLKSVKSSLSHFDNENGFLPLRAICDLEFVLDPNTNLLKDDVRL